MAFKFDFGGDGAATVSGGGDGFKFNFGGDEDEGGKSEDGKAFDFDEYRNTPDGMVKARSLTSAAIRYISVACVAYISTPSRRHRRWHFLCCIFLSELGTVSLLAREG